MSGQYLYRLYVHFNQERDIAVELWEDLTDQDRAIWEDMATQIGVEFTAK